ncbi:MAG: SPOR domain-containing protein [Gammaproteobacteria bacterium]
MNTQHTNYSDIATAHNRNTTAGNANISNVLSQIQDDGPAYADSHADLQRQDNSMAISPDISPDISHITSGVPQSEALNNEKKQAELSAAFSNRKNKQATPKAKGFNKNKNAWIQSSLIVFVALIIMIFLFRLDARTNQLEVSLSSLDDDVLDSIDTYSSELSPGFRSIKKTLKAVKQELELIKANTVSETKVDNSVVSKSSTSNQFQQPLINDNISIMEDEILTLKDELKIAKDKLEAINANSRQYKNPAADNKAAITSTITTTGWVVSLASFTNRNKAEKALQPLYAAGLFPLVQQVNVNGRGIYRLIIDGFASQADAKLFVRRADHEFGLQGGWIRKS